MQNKTSDQIVDTLMGFDHRQFQCRMTDGVADWHLHRQELRSENRLCLKALALVALLVLPSYLFKATTNYRLSNGMTYAEAVANTNTLLGL